MKITKHKFIKINLKLYLLDIKGLGDIIFHVNILNKNYKQLNIFNTTIKFPNKN